MGKTAVGINAAIQLRERQPFRFQVHVRLCSLFGMRTHLMKAVLGSYMVQEDEGAEATYGIQSYHWPSRSGSRRIQKLPQSWRRLETDLGRNDLRKDSLNDNSGFYNAPAHGVLTRLFSNQTFGATMPVSQVYFYRRLVISFRTSSVFAVPPKSGVSSLPSARFASTAW